MSYKIKPKFNNTVIIGNNSRIELTGKTTQTALKNLYNEGHKDKIDFTDEPKTDKKQNTSGK